jgi:hypothetical protein
MNLLGFELASHPVLLPVEESAFMRRGDYWIERL